MRDVTDNDTCPRCQKCDRWRNAPEYIRDPWVLWDRFPCPPPGTPNKARLLIELDWTGRLGARDGCKALRRVASRCKVDLTSVELSADSLSDCDELFTVFGLCGTQCVIAIILACICLMFVFLLVIVCCRYVRRADKHMENPCTKTVNNDQTAINTQINRYYVQSQHYYRAGNIPERRGLPFEARATENGVEARLIKAIQQTPLQGYQFDDMCSQCQRSISRQSTLSGRSRQGYERIYWRDKENLDKRVPSHESLTHRRASDRHRSIAGSSSDMSHYYEYISDNPYDGSTGRRSNHSTLYFPRNSSSNFKDVSNYGDSRCSDDERVLMLSRFINTEMELRNNSNPHRELVPYKPTQYFPYEEDQPQLSASQQDQIIYHGSLKEQNHYHGSLNDPYVADSSVPVTQNIGHGVQEENSTRSTPKLLEGTIFGEQMKGYKYTYNPSYDDETTTTASKNDHRDYSSSPCTPSDCLEFDDLSCNRDFCDSSSSPKCRKAKSKSRTPSLRSNRNSESTSLSDNNSLSNSLNIPKTNGSFYKGTRQK
ncbi:uncharacterized protein LOC123541046 [Mercenaria mercenaria]|uniref:uncharacterized protein LOC123541046 n=1 Tax=Mercenaria mercenaria TaxID=6596 RepID=UPI00234F99AA|nr:uncharacterized protein LOC123541046 [Mercenaria mercenaria]XP_045182344.2 uncharacterized protein LOC123541046 [Mercenaria mercenaria]XP_045182345.2 uncharacterized protein LOC123541046 [Mercenaria mercenaria]XP_045182362.2 uncharacterized protein LOC123541046 [Mercenaria mercenaria]XP_045182369.2 uncharacterized protein LOC123541046 [Mercenaria mercenaria]XP_045182378.2 uncharacterized protein LOC123541046 [Mercenaria mercenaria]XP_045182384.2 uncharacterized protein LOC123541046 [Mercen